MSSGSPRSNQSAQDIMMNAENSRKTYTNAKIPETLSHSRSVIGDRESSFNNEVSTHLMDLSTSRSSTFDPNELPDGAHLSPIKKGHQRYDSEHSAVRNADYIGSFAVVGDDQNSRSEMVRKQLASMRTSSSVQSGEPDRSKPVLLVISLSGIKVCASGGESVYMAHALKRVSYATCDPEYCQFSFLAREPKGHTTLQYCHAFVTKYSEEAEELNNIVGNAFQMAYAYQRQVANQKAQPSFNDVIQKQIDDQQVEFQEYNKERQKSLQKKLKTISTGTVADRMRERKERKRIEQEKHAREQEELRVHGKERTQWAKHAVPRSKHWSPLTPEIQPESRISPLARPPSNPDARLNCDNLPSSSNSNRINDAGRSRHESGESQRSSASIASIKEAFNTGTFSGSPVMALKLTIDSHYPSSSHDTADGALQMTNDNDQGMNGNSTSASMDNYLQPISAPSPDNQVNSGANSKLLTSPEDKTSKKTGKAKSKGNDPNRKSGFFGTSKGKKDGKSSPARTSPPNIKNQSRPVSVMYQNDGPVQSGIAAGEGGGVYAGPTTMRRFDMTNADFSNPADSDGSLKQASWYQAGIPREIALDVLSQQEIGSFIIRDSTTHQHCFALSVRVPKFENASGISHYLITRSDKGGFRLKGLDKEWPNLSALVTHHTVMPEMLPCTLRLPRKSNNPAFRDQEEREERDPEEDEDYQKLTNCSMMMESLSLGR